MAWDLYVSRTERPRPQPLQAPAIHYSWMNLQMCEKQAGRALGSRSSRGHGTRSLARSIKHREPAVFFKLSCLSSSSHGSECHVESWLKIYTGKFLVHFTLQWRSLWRMPFRSLRPWAIMSFERTANSIGFLWMLQRKSFACDIHLGDFFCDHQNGCIHWEAVDLLRGMTLGQLLGVGRYMYPMFQAVPTWTGINEERACSMDMALAEGTLATFALRGNRWRCCFGLISFERQKEVNHFQIKMVVRRVAEGALWRA